MIKWLKKNHLRFFIGADGYPRVLVSDLNPGQKNKKIVPNFEALTYGQETEVS